MVISDIILYMGLLLIHPNPDSCKSPKSYKSFSKYILKALTFYETEIIY